MLPVNNKSAFMETVDFLPRRFRLRSELEIMSEWTEMPVPLVSICCATFNHVNWLEDAIRGFLAQETTFPFEIIIRDDASTDGTTDVLKKYAALYPNIIRPLINESNRYSLGERPSHVWPQLVRGKYVALCEGDDYWISPTKLSKQVALLEIRRDAVMCVARSHVCNIDKHTKRLIYLRTTTESSHSSINDSELDNIYYHTSTYLIKSINFCEVMNKHFVGQTVFGDTAMRALLIEHGPFVCLPDVVSVYRVTGEGIWTSLDREKQLLWEITNAQKLSEIFTDSKRTKYLKNLVNFKADLLFYYIKKGKIRLAFNFHPFIYFLMAKRFSASLLRFLMNRMR